MTDEWKWTLRSSQSTRPVLRLREAGPKTPEDRPRMSNVFSETRGIVRVSAGDATSFAASGGQADLGTTFALATSLFGSNQLELSGTDWYSAGGAITASFRYTPGGGTDQHPVSIGSTSLWIDPTREAVTNNV